MITKIKITEVSFNLWMDKQIMMQPHKGILLSNVKEWTTDSHDNMA